MFTLDQLKSFVAVAETLHYGQAADRLAITQPPLSRRIQQLERELGVALFSRAGRGVQLTPAGRAFLADARRILGMSDQAALSVRRIPSGQTGTVALGFTGSSAHSVLDPIVNATRERMPDIDLVLRERVSGTQLEELRAGELDLALVRPPMPSAGLAASLLQREPLVLAVPSSHRLADDRMHPHVKDLDGEAFIMYSPAEARYFYELLVSIFLDSGIAPRYVQHISQVHTILALVRAGLGVGLVPLAAVNMGIDGVALRTISGAENRPAELILAWRAGDAEPATEALRTLICQTVGV
ncbi:LysR family transcriptional regulator [Mycolicibacterium houstonense]|uniref:LysR family transcriptional regulator n=1 Tax=Mycolicibacterium houstonense TaxID=146021 RepID=UPI003F9E0ECD